jgi:thiamine-monophosphate kinase
MAERAHAAIDVSDGLARDVAHLAVASGVRAVIDSRALLGSLPSLTVAAHALGADPLELALYGGEDYALVVASPDVIDGFAEIGEIRDGAGVAVDIVGEERDIDPRGFDHFK